MKKATLSESAQRQKIVHRLILRRHSHEDIVQYCASKFNICERQVDKYIAKCKADILKRLDISFEENLSTAIVDMDRFVQDAEDAGDRKMVMAGKKELHELQRLKTIQVEVSGNKEKPLYIESKLDKLTPEQLEQLEQLLYDNSEQGADS